MNFGKFLRKSFLKEHFRKLLLCVMKSLTVNDTAENIRFYAKHFVFIHNFLLRENDALMLLASTSIAFSKVSVHRVTEIA